MDSPHGFIGRYHSRLVLMAFVAFVGVGLVNAASGSMAKVVAAMGVLAFLTALWMPIWIDFRSNDPRPSPKEAQRLSAASERARLAQDCTDQDAALLRGDWELGMYGRFPVHPSKMVETAEALRDCLEITGAQPIMSSLIKSITG